jgi:hypothetical protein
MDYEREINTLRADNLAFRIVVGKVLSELVRRHPALRHAIAEGFNRSADVADNLSTETAEHTAEAKRIIADMRAMVLGRD